MHKSARAYFLERASDASSGAYFGAILAWFFRGNEPMMLFWMALFVVLNVVLSYLNRRSNTYDAIKERIEDRMDALHFRGLWPTERLPTDEDVRRLKVAGEDDFAIVMYQTLHSVTSKEARRAVKAL